MTEDFERELEKHLDAFPERWNLVSEMRKEWKDFKKRFLWLIVGSASAFVAIGVWVGTVQSEHNYIKENIDKEATTNIRIETRIDSLEINNSEIKARLAAIETTLLEIKTAILRIQ